MVRIATVVCAGSLLLVVLACQLDGAEGQVGDQRIAAEPVRSAAHVETPMGGGSQPQAKPEQAAEPSQPAPPTDSDAPGSQAPEVLGEEQSADEAVFAENAFPPPIPDTESHVESWAILDCLRCHETGVAEAPMIRHASVPDIAREAKCRSCHVLIPGYLPPPREPDPEEHLFLANAFPPMIPASDSHREAWLKDSCLLCHESGVKDAPIIKHEGLPAVLLEAKCRSCHVQVRSTAIPGR
jgi:hypothetical protein